MLLSEKEQAAGKVKTDLLSLVEKVKKQTEALAKTKQITVSVQEKPEKCHLGILWQT